MTIRLTAAQRSAVEIYVTDPAHECTAFALRGFDLEVLVDTTTACEMLTDAANSADEDRSGAARALSNLVQRLRGRR